MCSILPEDKQGPVLDDIRKISKERRRHRSMARITAATVCPSASDGLTGVYRSLSELSTTVTAVSGGESGQTADRLWAGATSGSSLMATVRTARRKQSMSATVVYNPAFYDAPVTVVPVATSNPAGQPYLRMTPENGFSLHQKPSDAADPETQLQTPSN